MNLRERVMQYFSSYCDKMFVFEYVFIDWNKEYICWSRWKISYISADIKEKQPQFIFPQSIHKLLIQFSAALLELRPPAEGDDFQRCSTYGEGAQQGALTGSSRIATTRLGQGPFDYGVVERIDRNRVTTATSGHLRFATRTHTRVNSYSEVIRLCRLDRFS